MIVLLKPNIETLALAKVDAIKKGRFQISPSLLG